MSRRLEFCCVPELTQPERRILRDFSSGGGTDSTSNTSTTTNQVDKRQVVDTNSVGVSSDSSTVNVTQVVPGAVDHAIDLSKSSSEQAYKGLVEILGLAKDVIGLQKETAAHVGEAYQSATDSATGVQSISKTLGYAALAVIGLVAVKSYAKG